jgi:predicted dehydrogenase
MKEKTTGLPVREILTGKATEQRLKLGVVGVGYLGEFHVQKYAAMEDIDLVGIADIDLERAQVMARKYNTKAYDSHTKLLTHVDGLSLAVPTMAHFEIGHDILDHGIHLLIEKPITFELSDADRLIEVAKKRNAILQIGHVERFNPAVIKMESMLSLPLFIDCHRYALFTNRGIDVDVILDLMIHDLDIILHIVNSEIQEIHAFGIPVVSGKIDIANVRILFSNGTVANLNASRISNESLRIIRIIQPDNCISIDYGRRKINISRFTGNEKYAADFSPIIYQEDEFPDSDPLADQIRSFVEAIKTKTEPKVTGLDGKKALEVALSIIDQIRKNKSQDIILN